jgi:hypothetical protein
VSPIILIIPKIGGQRVGMNQDNTMTVQRDAARSLRVSSIALLFPQEWGLNQDNTMRVQRDAAGSLRVSLNSPLSSPKTGGLRGFIQSL